MAREIERRFLVNKDLLPKLKEGTHQIQGYLNESQSSSPEVRIRVENNRKALLTLKWFIDFTTREEFEHQIPINDGLKLLKRTERKVEKIRHKLFLDQKEWVIDFFQAENSPLVLAEIELRTQGEKFIKPLWCEKEVTQNLSYTALSLAFNPFKNWEN